MKERNYSIDILKFVCAILVVFIHTDWEWHDAILPLTRCAVPCFLIISGFLLYTKDIGIGQERLKRNVKHIFHIILWSSLLFAILREGKAIIKGEFFIPTNEQIFNFLLLNDNPFGFHLWYLGAYLYVLIIMIIVDKYKIWTYMLYLTPFLLIGDLAFGKYSLLLFGHEYPYIYVRNFLFVGLPYFMIGVWIKKEIDNLKSIKKYVYWGGVILFSCTSILEKNILLYLDKSPAREHYISTTFLAISLFMLIMSFKNAKLSWITKIGERDSLYIYLFHPMLIMMSSIIIKRMPLEFIIWYQWVAPLVIILLTMLLILSLRKCTIIR